ncbi:amino acid ABC transporter substrate-binding protein [Hoyosella rhizosphaerae]|nr:amino acid ABC transporter substrate-binding protein [Hoyosella rhizosphaerae]
MLGYALVGPFMAAALVATGCNSSAPDSPAEPDPLPPPGSLRLPNATPEGIPPRCGPGGGRTLEDAQLTIAVDDPAFAPWIIDNDPTTGEGFEGAVAHAVATTLGYDSGSTTFVRVPFSDALASGPKDFDFAINQFSIIGPRRDFVDFSSPYYAVAQAVVALEGTAAASAENLEDLEDLQIGAYADSTSLYSATHSIKPTRAPIGFATHGEALNALALGEIDAVVADLPTAVRMAEEQLGGGIVVGKFPAPNEVTEFFGLVLEKDSEFTECASLALEHLHNDGVLEELADEWLVGSDVIPVLR